MEQKFDNVRELDYEPYLLGRVKFDWFPRSQKAFFYEGGGVKISSYWSLPYNPQLQISSER